MLGKSLLSLTQANNENNKTSLDLIESIIAEISTQPRIFYENSVEILYNIGEAYRALGKIDKAKIYFKQAFKEMNRIADMLNEEDRKLFLYNIKIHKNINGSIS
jgi:tetratricopeptide (TPR) repeat protein